METHRSPHVARLRLAMLFAASCLAVLAVACTGNDGKPDSRCNPAVIDFEGEATDEVCKTILDAEDAGQVQLGGTNAAVFTIPSNGGILDASGPTITLRWTSAIDSDGDTAFAPHEPPITGAVHMIRLKGTSAYPDGIVFFTTLLHWTMGGGYRDAVAATAGPMQIEITSAYVTQNRILDPPNDGPFRPAADRTFTVTP